MSRVQDLVAKGVTVPVPDSVEVADDVDLDLVSPGVTLHAGTRLRGSHTVLSAGCVLGAEGPVTVEDCQLGEGVELKGGYASKAVFLAGANLGLGHHVREGCLLEEEAGGAHTVGLKQTILFPFVTLGSLINFCDAFMAGGTSRSDHSEVGSSYIHFNFTPHQDKATASMFGDVPRGVMLRQRPIFLGGQGGAVGPVRVAYGTVVGAGSILRTDISEPDQLVVVGPTPDLARPFAPDRYKRIGTIAARGISYLAHLAALEQWYRHARAPFLTRTELGQHLLDGALAAIASARRERLTRLQKVVAKLDPTDATHAAVVEAMPQLAEIVGAAQGTPAADVVATLTRQAAAGTGYVAAVQGLHDDLVAAGTGWLQTIVDDVEAAAADACGVLDFG